MEVRYVIAMDSQHITFQSAGEMQDDMAIQYSTVVNNIGVIQSAILRAQLFSDEHQCHDYLG
jgi:hypothetical protein